MRKNNNHSFLQSKVLRISFLLLVILTASVFYLLFQNKQLTTKLQEMGNANARLVGNEMIDEAEDLTESLSKACEIKFDLPAAYSIEAPSSGITRLNFKAVLGKSCYEVTNGKVRISVNAFMSSQVSMDEFASGRELETNYNRTPQDISTSVLIRKDKITGKEKIIFERNDLYTKYEMAGYGGGMDVIVTQVGPYIYQFVWQIESGDEEAVVMKLIDQLHGR